VVGAELQALKVEQADLAVVMVEIYLALLLVVQAQLTKDTLVVGLEIVEALTVLAAAAALEQ
jgi:hypothetical protein